MRDPKPRRSPAAPTLAAKLRKHSTLLLLLLWFAFSLALFLSATPPAAAPLSRSSFLRSKPRALAATTTGAAAPPVRIYVYDLPARFNRDWAATRRAVRAPPLRDRGGGAVLDPLLRLAEGEAVVAEGHLDVDGGERVHLHVEVVAGVVLVRVAPREVEPAGAWQRRREQEGLGWAGGSVVALGPAPARSSLEEGEEGVSVAAEQI